jgi:hypothetical protein
VDKSFANGNSFDAGNSPGSKPPTAAACSTTFWELVHGTSPRQFAS